MARPLRIEFPGALYHVTSRGNARSPTFLDDGDRHAFIRELVQSGRYTAAEIGRHIGMHYSTISRIAAQRKDGAPSPSTDPSEGGFKIQDPTP
jgi:hypothetical protein